MKINLKKPLAVFDLETTGTNIARDRIVELSIVKVLPDNSRTTHTRRINPTIPIPAEATRVHGITDADVAEMPTFKQVAKSLLQLLDGCDLAGFNVLKFDIPMLIEEFLRADIVLDMGHRKIIDAQRIFHLMEPRTLSAAYKFYCNAALENAHSAEADTLATLAVLEAQIERYEGVETKDMDGNVLMPVKNDMAHLHQLSASNLVDYAGRMILNEKGIEIFNFGKYKDQPVSEVLGKDPSYYDWMMKGEFPLDTKRKLTELKLRGFNRK
jgi:DNA polymerase III subunit epsilon